MQMTFRPIEWGLSERTRDVERRGSWAFKASWTSTLTLLDHELRQLDAHNVVLQADYSEADIRLDGMPRANARNPQFPGVRLLFDSKYGPLVYATDLYSTWQANVRAIALSLEALRKVDRYGVTKAAEQYKGWKVLGSGGDAKDDAMQTLLDIADPDVPGLLAGNLTLLYRTAVKKAHPDQGGSREQWDAVQHAKEVLGL